MKTIEEIRHDNLLMLLGRFPTLQAFSDKIGVDSRQVGQWKNKNKRSNGSIYRLDSNSARAIEIKLNLDPGWLDNDPNAWPLERVQQSRYRDLDAADRAEVQGAMNNAIAQCEARHAQAATHLHTGHGGLDSAHHVHEQRKQFGT